MINFSTVINSDQILVFLKKETIDYVRNYLVSQGDMTTTYDDILQEWVNWQKKAQQEQQG